MFLKTTKIQLKLYEEELINLIGKCDAIIQFCATPILCKNLKIPGKDKKELETIVAKMKLISCKLEDIKKDIQSL